MTPVKEDENITSSLTNIKAKHLIRNIVSSFDELDLLNFKPILEINYKKPRNQMKHLTPKKKKRKK
jgi:hypothetical protein